MIHIIADGITYTQGIYVVDLKKQLNEGSAAVSWISSILVGVTLGSGKAYFFLTYLSGLFFIEMARLENGSGSSNICSGPVFWNKIRSLNLDLKNLKLSLLSR